MTAAKRSTPIIAAGVALGALVCLALLAQVAHTTFGFGSPALDFAIEEWAYDFVTMSAALVVLGVAAFRREGRLAWALIGAGLLAWAAADLYYTTVLGPLDEPPFPSAADAAYLGGYVLLLGGLIALVRTRTRRMSALVWTDVAIGSLCIAAIGASLLMDFVLENSSGSALGVAVAVGYPLFDLAILTVAAAALALTGWRPGRTLALVAAGMALTGIGDAVYTHQSLAGTYDAQDWNNSLWPIGVALIALGALVKPPRQTIRGLPEGWGAFASPLIFALAVLALLLLSNQSTDTPVVAALTVATLVAVVVRLAITFAENRHLLDRLQHDPLTGLANRGRLFIDLPRAIEDGDPHTVAILDLDGFKAYNDAFGHPAGDTLLVRLGGRLDASVRRRGSAYRLGGDEFALIVPGTGDRAEAILKNARRALSDRGDGFSIGASFGTVEVPSEARDPSAALELADQRMYAQKDSRRPAPGGEVQAVLLRLLQHRAPALGAHGDSVAALAVAVGEQIGMQAGALQALRWAAELHDVGKIAIPDAILDKTGPLNDEEWEFMRQHTVLGERILSAATSLGSLGRIVRSSHERWDGGGYPDGLEGEQIPLAARIVFVCDAYDAMTSERRYAKPRTGAEAIAELRANAGTQFDPAVVEALCAALERAGGRPGRAEKVFA
ncbi:MAG: diguanylate cyclase [Actinomycetota bacterium]|nr:diguanylate cyclase [Actinomycetota bacterium]